MNEIILSIIIPVYNVELYLKECIESIRTQMTSTCELILIDDGSTDCSGNICDEYASRNRRITVIHKKNGGHSSARNLGLDAARGEYVCFVDSDDKIYQNSVAELLRCIDSTEADIYFLHGFKFFPNGAIVDLGDNIKAEQVNGKTRREVLGYIGSRPKYPGSACTKVFRREFLAENQLRFPENLTHSEDLTFCLDCLLAAQTFAALDVPYYLYRQSRPGSMTGSISASSASGLSDFIRNTAIKIMEQEEHDSRPYTCLLPILAYEYTILLWQYGLLKNRDAKSKAYETLREYSWVMAYGRTKRLRLIRTLQSVIGIKGTSLVLVFVMKLRGLKNRR